MDIPSWVWLTTVGVASAFLIFDIWHVARNPHEPSQRELIVAFVGYVGAAMIFGLGIWYFSGGRYAGEFYAGFLTEKLLSVDNLFVFILIMTSFKVPRKYQQTALLVGIVLAIVLRGLFIWAGAAALEAWSWAFYLFGAFLIYTAATLLKDDDDDEFTENALMKFMRKNSNVTDEFHGTKSFVRIDGKRYLTPMLMVFIALGTTDVLFALDSIPAIYGLTQEPYLVLMANLFALMGLRQLYFLIGDLLKRLVFLSYGLAFLLGFIGLKLVFHAMHVNELPFINNGEHIEWAPEIPIWLSLVIIVGTLAVTTVASLLYTKHQNKVNGTAGD